MAKTPEQKQREREALGAPTPAGPQPTDLIRQQTMAATAQAGVVQQQYINRLNFIANYAVNSLQRIEELIGNDFKESAAAINTVIGNLQNIMQDLQNLNPEEIPNAVDNLRDTLEDANDEVEKVAEEADSQDKLYAPELEKSQEDLSTTVKNVETMQKNQKASEEEVTAAKEVPAPTPTPEASAEETAPKLTPTSGG